MNKATGPAVAHMVTSYTPGNKEQKATPGKRYEKILTSIIGQIGNKEEELVQSEKKCPECGRKFSILFVEDVEVDYCVFCHSVWLDFGELSKLSGFSVDVPGQTLTSRKSKYDCPICEKQMKEYLFVERNNLLVDKCTENHGVYLESGELRRVFDIVDK